MFTQKYLFLVVWICFLIATPSGARAETIYAFACPETEIKASIPYNLIGKYVAQFTNCKGLIEYDSAAKEFKKVAIKIDAGSIRSNCAWCDRVVRSRRILETAVYPFLTFQGERFALIDSEPGVTGDLTVHGVTKPLEFKFNIVEADERFLIIEGTWLIRRKDFKIIWSKVLDHGGVVVGDTVTLKWRVRARRINKEADIK